MNGEDESSGKRLNCCWVESKYYGGVGRKNERRDVFIAGGKSRGLNHAPLNNSWKSVKCESVECEFKDLIQHVPSYSTYACVNKVFEILRASRSG